jgi:hypothetical protein
MRSLSRVVLLCASLLPASAATAEEIRCPPPSALGPAEWQAVYYGGLSEVRLQRAIVPNPTRRVEILCLRESGAMVLRFDDRNCNLVAGTGKNAAPVQLGNGETTTCRTQGAAGFHTNDVQCKVVCD